MPWWARPLIALYGYSIGILLFVVFVLFRLTCRVQWINQDQADALPNYIGCVWHDRVASYFPAMVLRRFRKNAWLNHPAVYMKPIHVVIKWIGVDKIIMG